MSKRLSDGAIARIKPQAQRIEYADAGAPGLYVVIHPTGAKAFAYRYRYRGVPRKLTIGGVDIGIKEARKIVKKHAGAVAHGRDPAGEKQEEKAQEQDRVDKVMEEFLNKHIRTKKG